MKKITLHRRIIILVPDFDSRSFVGVSGRHIFVVISNLKTERCVNSIS